VDIIIASSCSLGLRSSGGTTVTSRRGSLYHNICGVNTSVICSEKWTHPIVPNPPAYHEKLHYHISIQRYTLHRAAKLGRDEVVEMLLEADASQENVDDSFRLAPIHWAAAGGYTEVVKLLIWKTKFRPECQVRDI
jgi:hypothetical protein